MPFFLIPSFWICSKTIISWRYVFVNKQFWIYLGCVPKCSKSVHHWCKFQQKKKQNNVMVSKMCDNTANNSHYNSWRSNYAAMKQRYWIYKRTHSLQIWNALQHFELRYTRIDPVKMHMHFRNHIKPMRTKTYLLYFNAVVSQNQIQTSNIFFFIFDLHLYWNGYNSKYIFENFLFIV